MRANVLILAVPTAAPRVEPEAIPNSVRWWNARKPTSGHGDLVARELAADVQEGTWCKLPGMRNAWALLGKWCWELDTRTFPPGRYCSDYYTLQTGAEEYKKSRRCVQLSTDNIPLATIN